MVVWRNWFNDLTESRIHVLASNQIPVVPHSYNTLSSFLSLSRLNAFIHNVELLSTMYIFQKGSLV